MKGEKAEMRPERRRKCGFGVKREKRDRQMREKRWRERHKGRERKRETGRKSKGTEETERKKRHEKRERETLLDTMERERKRTKEGENRMKKERQERPYRCKVDPGCSELRNGGILVSRCQSLQLLSARRKKQKRMIE